jgi:hypothetical protein
MKGMVFHMNEDKNIDSLTENVAAEDITPQKPHSGGSILARRFIIYDKLKISVKAIDCIIISCVILLFLFFILGAYMK